MQNKEKEIIGTIGICNTMGLAVLEIDQYNDRIKTQFVVVGEGFKGKPGWCKIMYDKEGRAYFTKTGNRYYLSDIMRTNY